LVRIVLCFRCLVLIWVVIDDFGSGYLVLVYFSWLLVLIFKLD